MADKIEFQSGGAEYPPEALHVAYDRGFREGQEDALQVLRADGWAPPTDNRDTPNPSGPGVEGTRNFLDRVRRRGEGDG